MAIYGIGAYYDGTTDVSSDFLAQEVACLGLSRADAPALHRLLGHIKAGDIIYIKAHPPGRDLIIKAVGIVRDEELRDYGNLGQGLRVRWIWQGSHIVREGMGEKYNVRSNTLYEEVSPDIQALILDLLLSELKPAPVA